MRQVSRPAAGSSAGPGPRAALPGSRTAPAAQAGAVEPVLHRRQVLEGAAAALALASAAAPLAASAAPAARAPGDWSTPGLAVRALGIWLGLQASLCLGQSRATLLPAASRCLIPAAGSTDCAGEIILLAHLAQLAVLALLPSQHYLSASGSGGSHDSQRSGAARSPCVDRGPPGCREWCDGGKGKHGCLVWPAAGAGSGRAGSAGGGRQRTCRRWRRRCCRAARSPRQVPHRSGSDALRLGSGQLLPAGCCGERYRHGEAGSECWACRPPPGMWEIGV